MTTNRSRLTWCASLALMPFLGIAACNDSAVDPRRVLTTVNVPVGAVTLEVGEMTGATASGFDQDGAPFSLGTVAFSSDAPTIAAVTSATGFILAISPGATRIVATADGVAGERAITVARAPAIRINDVQSRGDGPGGCIPPSTPTKGAGNACPAGGSALGVANVAQVASR